MSDYVDIKPIKSTRKQHLCFLCRRHYPKKSQMYKWYGVFEGQFFSSHLCTTCRELLKVLDQDDGYCEGDVLNYMSDYEANTPEELLDKIRIGPSF